VGLPPVETFSLKVGGWPNGVKDEIFFGYFSKIADIFRPLKRDEITSEQTCSLRDHLNIVDATINMRPRPMRCVSTIVSNAEVSFHDGFIQEVAGSGVELAFRGYLTQKTSWISRRSCETGHEKRERRVCVLWAAKKAVSYLIPTLILYFHTIEYFVPF